MKNLENREGYFNRHLDPLPNKSLEIEIITKDITGEFNYICLWQPFRKEFYSEKNLPGKGYLGTAKIVEGMFKGIGFHAWEQNDSEFIYYKII